MHFDSDQSATDEEMEFVNRIVRLNSVEILRYLIKNVNNMTDSERIKLERIAENSEGFQAKEAMIKLRIINPTYHWCPDWDDAVISDKHNEWECCTCDVKLKNKLNGLSK